MKSHPQRVVARNRVHGRVPIIGEHLNFATPESCVMRCLLASKRSGPLLLDYSFAVAVTPSGQLFVCETSQTRTIWINVCRALRVNHVTVAWVSTEHDVTRSAIRVSTAGSSRCRLIQSPLNFSDASRRRAVLRFVKRSRNIV